MKAMAELPPERPPRPRRPPFVPVAAAPLVMPKRTPLSDHEHRNPQRFNKHFGTSTR
jgi:hypothetical protein